jgi:hypothetical protein
MLAFGHNDLHGRYTQHRLGAKETKSSGTHPAGSVAELDVELAELDVELAEDDGEPDAELAEDDGELDAGFGISSMSSSKPPLIPSSRILRR